jgi:RecQ-mediated genome instability protein 1
MWQCVLTGVKDFQFKGGDEFRLIVYVDDGSLTSEVLIHNQVKHPIWSVLHTTD